MIYDSKIIQKQFIFYKIYLQINRNLQIKNTFIDEPKKYANFTFWLYKTYICYIYIYNMCKLKYFIALELYYYS